MALNNLSVHPSNILPGTWCGSWAIEKLTGNKRCHDGDLSERELRAALRSSAIRFDDIPDPRDENGMAFGISELKLELALFADGHRCPHLVFTRDHVVITDSGKIFDNHAPGGVSAVQHPFAKSYVVSASRLNIASLVPA